MHVETRLNVWKACILIRQPVAVGRCYENTTDAFAKRITAIRLGRAVHNTIATRR